MHVEPSASVQASLANVAMTVRGTSGEDKPPRAPIPLDKAALQRLEEEMVALANDTANLLADTRRRENAVRAAYRGTSELDEHTTDFLWQQMNKKNDEIRAELDAEWQAKFAGRVRACVLLAADNGFTDESMNDALGTGAEWIIRDQAPAALLSLAEQIRYGRMSRARPDNGPS
jgi:hypothetical protein